MAFIALVAGNLSLALADTSSGSARLCDLRRIACWAIGALAVLILAVCLGVGPLRELLRFAVPSPLQLSSSLMLGIAAGG